MNKIQESKKGLVIEVVDHYELEFEIYPPNTG